MKIKTNYRWVIKIVLASVIASILFTLLSTEVLVRAGYIIAFAVLAVFIALGIFVDIIAIAVTVVPETALNSMAAHKVRGAPEALRLKKNADRVTSFCNDVIGDVTGIISGATAALIAARLMLSLNMDGLLLSLLLTGVVAGLSVGGKAIAKSFAFNHSTVIVLHVGKLINLFKKMKG